MVGAEQCRVADSARHHGTPGSMPADVPVWVAVSAVDNVGNESAMTPAQSVTPNKLVDDDSIRDAVGRHRRQDRRCGSMTLTMRSTTSSSTKLEPRPTGCRPSQTRRRTRRQRPAILWFDTSTAGKNKLHRYDGVSWVSAADERIDTIDRRRTTLKPTWTACARVSTVRTQSLNPPAPRRSQYDGAVGDIWEIMSSMGSGGRSVSRWRWNGTVWVSNLIGDTVLGNVDAAKIGTGYLDADRIEAG